jgi:hypothetical protein
MKRTFLNCSKPDAPDLIKRAKKHIKSRAEDFRAFMKADDLENAGDYVGSFYNYGLSVDYQEPEGRRRGYLRYQLSTGGPGEEIRFYSDNGRNCDRIEFVFLDWFVGVGFDVTGEEWAAWLWDWFEGCGTFQAEKEKAEKE